MMKVIRILPVLLLIAACQNRQAVTGRKIISVSILPQKYFAEAIAGDKYDISVMIPPGGNPETYEPTPRQMRNLSESQIYFKIGNIPFEEIWLDNIHDFNPGIKVFDISRGIELISGGHLLGTDPDHAGADPHIWSSARNASVIAKNIHDALLLTDPMNASFYSARLKKFRSFADSLDLEFKSALNKSSVKSFIIFHPALGYFARDYGLEQIAVEFEGKSPPPGHMRDIINLARERGIRTIFIQKQFNVEAATSIAKEINGNLTVIDPLDENWDTQLGYIVSRITGN
jgi:zinc transport system substrate-binding protein